MSNIVGVFITIFGAFIFGTFVCVVVFFFETMGIWEMLLCWIDDDDVKIKIVVDVILHVVIFAIGFTIMFSMNG